MKTSTYTCLECGNEFDEPALWKQSHNSDLPNETWSGCPICGGAYTRTIICDGCLQPIDNEYVKTPSGDYCNACFDIYQLGDE